MNVTIVKDYHESAADFEEIRAYLGMFNVLSIEQNVASEKVACFLEDEIKAFFSTNLPASAFKEVHSENISGNEYNIRLWDYILSNRVPIILAERFMPEEHKKIMKQKEKANAPLEVSIETMFDDFARTMWDYVSFYNRYQDRRDRNVGSNVHQKVLNRIQKLYPYLSQGQINYGILMGVEHSPEKYIKGASVIPRSIDWERIDVSNITCLSNVNRTGGSLSDGSRYVIREYIRLLLVSMLIRPESEIHSEQIVNDLRTLRAEYDEVKYLSEQIRGLGLQFVKKEHQSLICNFLLSKGITKVGGEDISQMLGSL